jgi:hypothetical protein
MARDWIAPMAKARMRMRMKRREVERKINNQTASPELTGRVAA